MYMQKCTANIAVCFLMIGENYISDEKGSFMGKAVEMLERIIERGRFL